MRRMIGIFALVILILPAAAGAVEFGGIAAYPANPTPGDERTTAWFVYTLAPGGSKSDLLVIQNNTDQEKNLDLYPADSTPTTGDGFALKQKVEKMDAVGSWVELKTNSVSIAPHEKATVPFTVAVPKIAALGLYAGGIMVAEAGAAKESNGIRLNLRVGVRMYVTVVAAPRNVDGLPHSNSNPFWITGELLAVLLVLGGAYMMIVSKRKKKLDSWLR
jgi:hypothetical protein